MLDPEQATRGASQRTIQQGPGRFSERRSSDSSFFESFERSKPGLADQEGRNAVAAPEVISIVVADDDDALRAVTVDCLRAVGMSVWEAADGTQALTLVREHHPTVLVLDLWMPGLDGLQVLDALRYDPEAPRLSVVILTGDREADGRFLALAGGAARIILKGGPVDELIEAVRSCAELALGPPFGIFPDDDCQDDPGAVSLLRRAGDGDHQPSGPDQP